MKKVTCSCARHFVCRRCTDVGDGTEEPVEQWFLNWVRPNPRGSVRL